MNVPTHFKVSIQVIGRYRDALSRQVGEAVRIDLRGEDVLNSKAEFNRCRLPRLTINRDYWLFKNDPTPVIANPKEGPDGVSGDFPEAGGTFDDELGDSALWNLGNRKKASKRKKVNEEAKTGSIQEGREKKRAKLERLENWGETEVETELDVRSWLLKPAQTLEASRRMKQMEMEFSMVGTVKVSKTAVATLTILGSTQKQDEAAQSPNPNQSPTINQDINGEDITPKLKDVPPTPKPSLSIQQGGKKLAKKESLQLIRKINQKITSWIIPKPIIVIANDWSDDTSIPALLDTMDIERKENAKSKVEGWKRKRICCELVLEILMKAESISSISQSMNVLVEMAWRGIKENAFKNWLHEDVELIEFTTKLISSWQLEDRRKMEEERLE